MNFTEKVNQEYVKKQLETADFFAASAPCTTACIHHEPPLRTWHAGAESGTDDSSDDASNAGDAQTSSVCSCVCVQSPLCAIL